MYSLYNEGKSVIAERLIKTLYGKIYKRMTANDSKYDLCCLNKLTDRHNDTYHHSVGKNVLMLIILLWLKKIEKNPKAPKFTVGGRVRIAKYKNIFNKAYTDNWSREIFFMILC